MELIIMIRENTSTSGMEEGLENPRSIPQIFQDPDELEAEISRLTWAVLDGEANDLERRLLADLVSVQHEQRYGVRE